MFQKAYKDVIFCVASNKPMTTMIEMAETQDNSFRKNVWEPLESRVDFIHMEKSHSSKVDFPYTTCHLANALYFLAQHMDLVNTVENEDTAEIPKEVRDHATW